MAAQEPPCPGCFACCPGGLCCGGGGEDIEAWLHLPEVVFRAVAGLFTSTPVPGGGRSGLATRLAENLIREYQRRISARTAARCRFSPSCSSYGLEAVRRHGAWTGVRMIWQRLLRCRTAVPVGTADPVPAAA
ncbi:membrane protein insertion efficiency factor YidD [Catellatospora tritici]|uniref:membrane protein insertion efficiency factor YidD n=1 Tax=Catellatospora tritici TaxID=2851566 RepID=UPI001C2D0A4D|nr:membrane protein insertion efficiency factor YidD [Catellatospora tritici]MBV1854926.1 membrane protein insertion efficiency factor YidD [Catellatospora tritici]